AARGGIAAADRGGGKKAVQPGKGSDDPRDAVPAFADGARVDARDAPHRVRRLVDGDPLSRNWRVLRSVLERPAARVAGAACPIRRLCRVAAGVPAGRRPAEPDQLLEKADGRRPGAAGIANGSRAAAGAIAPRRYGGVAVAAGTGDETEAGERAASGDVFHDAARRFQSA